MNSVVITAGAVAFGFVVVLGATHAVRAVSGDPLRQCMEEAYTTMGLSQQVREATIPHALELARSRSDEALVACKAALADYASMPAEELASIRSGVGLVNVMAAANPAMLDAAITGSMPSFPSFDLETPAAEAASTSDPVLAAVAAEPIIEEAAVQEVATAWSPPKAVPAVVRKVEFVRVDVEEDALLPQVEMIRRAGKSDCTIQRAYSALDAKSGRIDANQGVILYCGGATGSALLMTDEADRVYIQDVADAAGMFEVSYSSTVQDVFVEQDRISVLMDGTSP